MFTSFGIKFRNSKPWKKLNSPDVASFQVERLGSWMTGFNKSRKNLVCRSVQVILEYIVCIVTGRE